MEFQNNGKSINKDVSIVVCTKNSANSIEEVLNSVRKNNPLEIILVDANSIDDTREIAKKYVTKILTDPGKGLAIARNLGLEQVKGKYTFFIGSDNVIGKNTLKRLIKYMKLHNYVGVAALTRLKNRNANYLTQGLDLRWQLRFYEGPREVIGTPYLYKTDVLRKFKFSPEMSWSDDSDLGARMANNGVKVGYSNIICWEIGVDTWKSVYYRFKMYGKGD